MNAVTEVLIMIGLFLLRLAVPLLITFGVAYLLRRLDAKWEAEASQETTAPDVLVEKVAQKPCWEEKGCPEAKRAQCPACKWHDLPCWLARIKVENSLPAECPDCPRFGRQLQPQPISV